MILGATVKKLWVFEVFGQGLAMAGMFWSQPARVDHLHKKWRAGEKKNSKKNGQIGLVRVSTRSWQATTGHRPTVGQQPAVDPRPRVDTWTRPICSIFFIF
jgi:hypothetical protein